MTPAPAVVPHLRPAGRPDPAEITRDAGILHDMFVDAFTAGTPPPPHWDLAAAMLLGAVAEMEAGP